MLERAGAHTLRRARSASSSIGLVARAAHRSGSDSFVGSSTSPGACGASRALRPSTASRSRAWSTNRISTNAATTAKTSPSASFSLSGSLPTVSPIVATIAITTTTPITPNHAERLKPPLTAGSVVGGKRVAGARKP
jgi:hypothetical protein